MFIASGDERQYNLKSAYAIYKMDGRDLDEKIGVDWWIWSRIYHSLLS